MNPTLGFQDLSNLDSHHEAIFEGQYFFQNREKTKTKQNKQRKNLRHFIKIVTQEFYDGGNYLWALTY